MAVTLRTIAERAGLSQAAVSQILNRKPNDLSSEGTRRKVFAIAEELGYKQKFGHKLLRGDETHTVALLIDMKRLALEEHIQALVMQLLARLEQSGYSSYFTLLGGDEAKNLQAVKELIERGTEGFVVIGAPTGEKMIEEEFIRQKKSFVGTGTHLSRDATVSPVRAVREILQFFLSRKRENFKFLLSPDFESTPRFAALKDFFPGLRTEELARKYCVELRRDTFDVDVLARIGYETTKAIFAEDPTVSALFYLSDYYAMGGLAFLAESGRTPGKEVLVAGYNNIHAVRTCLFPVSSAAHPTEELAEALTAGLKQEGPFARIIYAEAVIREAAGFAASERSSR